MRHLKTLLAATTAIACSLSAQADDIAIVGGTVIPMTDEAVMKGATVLVSGDKITAIGNDLTIPDGYTVIDATGKIVTPGFMASNTALGLHEVPSWAGVDDANARSVESPMTLDIRYGINPDNTVIPVNRVEGVTRASIGFSSYKGIYSGKGAVIHLGASDDLLVKPASFINVSVGDSGARKVGNRSAIWSDLEKKITKVSAKDTSKAKKKKKSKKTAAKPDPEMAVWKSIVAGDITIVMAANKVSDLRLILEFSEKHPALEIAIYGAAEGWRIANELAEAEIPVIISGKQNLPSNFESLGSTLENAGRLSAAGVDVAFIGDGNHRAHLIRQHAGLAVANGMSKEAALAALTTVPAGIYGVSDSYGTLANGMDADIVVWDGDPLELMTNADAVIIKGELQSGETRQTKLRDRYLTLPRSPQYK